MSTTSTNSELSRRFDDLTQHLDRLEERLPSVPARAIEFTRASVRRVNAVASGVAHDVGRQLGRTSSTAGDATSTTVGQARSGAGRTTSTASRTMKQTAGQARSAVDRTASTASRAIKETAGQARSAVNRTASTASRTTKETVGQARAQSERAARTAGCSTTALLDDATRAVDPVGDGKPASLDDWTKAELYERAQELDIDGRSSMSKRELLRALRTV